MDIAKAIDGWVILYALNEKIKKLETQKWALLARGSKLNSNFSKSISQEESVVNIRYSILDLDGEEKTRESFEETEQVLDSSSQIYSPWTK